MSYTESYADTIRTLEDIQKLYAIGDKYFYGGHTCYNGIKASVFFDIIEYELFLYMNDILSNQEVVQRVLNNCKYDPATELLSFMYYKILRLFFPSTFERMKHWTKNCMGYQIYFDYESGMFITKSIIEDFAHIEFSNGLVDSVSCKTFPVPNFLCNMYYDFDDFTLIWDSKDSIRVEQFYADNTYNIKYSDYWENGQFLKSKLIADINVDIQ